MKRSTMAFGVLARAIKDTGNPTQQCMLMKFAVFLRDCVPMGLTGDLDHIQGDNVMRYLLSH